jgi:hypothetical protein
MVDIFPLTKPAERKGKNNLNEKKKGGAKTSLNSDHDRLSMVKMSVEHSF